ncbi:YfdX family protein [Paracoccus stylophorae]|uniref:YfdX family protein n=1 Tax=Paracoccus stylophorae TaxID=659350 RepID=A0ABY7SUM3_9RHOB|nr:YfdX family protein [Paracoccus stylophorae]WCR09667.1 YfdX family protein [Paracoccus stylophorae]
MFDQAKKAAVSTLALATMLTVTPAFAQDNEQPPTSDTNAAVSEPVQDEATTKVDEKRKTLLKDATSALDKTKEALKALDDGDSDAALEALAVATGKLQSVVARDPDLALAPVDVQLVQRDLLGNVDAIRKAREQIEELVDDGKLQQARPLMRDFASEIVVETANLPLATYPDAILKATAEIDRGETEQAKQTLATALSTVVITEDTIALPVLRAQLLIDAAEDALGPDDGTAAETEATDTASADAEKSGEAATAEPLSPSEYVEAARQQLEIAEALGYGDKDDFKELHDNLNELDEKIDLADDTGGIFDKIGDSFIRLKQRIFD